MSTLLRSLIVAVIAAFSVAACFSGPSLNRPPYRYNEPVPAAPAPAGAESTQAPEKKQSQPASAPVAPLPSATPPATPGG